MTAAAPYTADNRPIAAAMLPFGSTDRRGGGDEYLAYSHRLLDAAAELGVPMVSFGFFQDFTAAQREALWFWLAAGRHDDESPEARSRAASFIRELAPHAAGNGQQFSLEMYEDTYVGTCDGAVKFLEDVGHEACGPNPHLGLGFRGAFLCEHHGSDAITVIGRNRAYVRELLATALD